MVSRRTLELWVGVFVAAGLLALGMLAFKVGNLSTAEIGAGYTVTAEFDNIGGLKVKAPVTLAGVRIGRVSKISVDRRNFRAVVTMNIADSYDNLPADSAAMIQTSGVLGEQYVAISPGADTRVLKNGDRITLTQSAMVLENLIGQFLYNMGSKGSK